jgi:Nif-specific regulatory protein
MIVLEVIAGDQKGRVFEFEGTRSTLSIGRAPSAVVALTDYHLSGEHGEIFREHDQYVYRDLRSTNGSRVERAGQRLEIDGGKPALTLHDGDQLLLGDPVTPVVLRCRLVMDEEAAGARVLAVKPISELPELTGRLERDPGGAAALYPLVRKIGRRGLDLSRVLDGVAEAVFELLPKATHVSILLADETDAGRLVPVLARARSGAHDPVSTSRAVLRRVLQDHAAVLAANAADDLGQTESILGARILSTLGVPLWDGDEIRGIIQCDNRASAGIFQERDLELVTMLASSAALAIENARLVSRLQVADEQLRRENQYLKGRAERRFENMIGRSDAMRALLRQLEKVIDTRATVCIEGETGTGKELIAGTIHHQGRRRDLLFVALNCAAVPENLLESELFGHKKGAFTGADHDKKGLFEIAHGGTLFLDEVGEMSLPLQAKLLRVLQEGEVRPLGATTPRSVDVRIICATNRPLEKAVESGTFRQDLYYRLKVFPIKMPPLRERREDIPLLAEHFLARYTRESKKAVMGFSKDALDQLMSYSWPGNIRELENEVQRIVIQCDEGAFVTAEVLSPAIRKVEGLVGRAAPKAGTLKDRMEEVERWLLAEALRESGGNKTRAAESLGITREGLHKKLSKFGM